MNAAEQPGGTDADALRKQAVESLRRKAAFRYHLAIYLVVNAVLIAIWALSDGGGGFWPGWSIGFWGLGVAVQGWHAYGPRRGGLSEDQISAEMERLRR